MKNAAVLIGTSGFGVAREKYFQMFSCVEVQHTFYEPPKISTLERWRETAPPDFEFVIKAWQLITHDAKSPTYRRLKKKLSEAEKQEAGYFRPSAIVSEAWQATLTSARALKARTILFQCPASFKQTEENIQNLTTFFGSMNRTFDRKTEVRQKKSGKQMEFAWEPRGDWDPKVIKEICDEVNLRHAVDPFTATSVTPSKIYLRLHGRNGWRYQYEEAELRELASMLTRKGRGYIFFNNARMTQDAMSFKTLTGEK